MTSDPHRQPPRTDDDEIDLADLVYRLWAGKVWILVFTTFAAVVGLIIALGTTPTYRADALLQLEEKTGHLALPSAFSDLAGAEPRSVTEIEILRSRLVLGRAVAEAHMDWQVAPKTLPVFLSALVKLGIPLPDMPSLTAYARDGEVVMIDLLEVPRHWLGEEIELVTGPEGAFHITLPDGTVLTSEAGEPLIDADIGFALGISELRAPAGRVFILRHLSEAHAINGLRKRLSVSERGRQTGILELGLTGETPALIERDLEAITQAYLRQNISRSAAEAENSLTFVESQLPEAEATVRRAQDALNQYRQEQQAIDLGFEGQSLLTQITTLEAELQRLDNEETVLAERYRPSHPAYQTLLSARARAQERVATLRAQVEDLPQTQLAVFNLTRDVDLAQEVYVQLLNRAQELRVLKASTVGNVRIVDQARTSPEPVAPRRARVLALSLVLGMIAGIGFVLLRNLFRRGIQDAEQLETLGLPVFATINHLPAAVEHRKRKDRLPLHALTHSNDLAIEGLRSLRTSLHFGLIDASTRSIALTSSAPAVGKSFISSNLGVVAAQAGQKVCLVDADLRRGHLRRYFDVPKVHGGLSEYLAGEAGLDELLVEVPVPGLFFLPTGQLPPNPSELLMRDRFQNLVEELDRRFDLSLIDTPPVLAVTDPMIIARSVGATILVARFDVTPLGEIEAVQRQFLNAGLRINGTVLNAFDPRRARSRSAYGYGYSYRYDYKSGTTKT